MLTNNKIIIADILGLLLRYRLSSQQNCLSETVKQLFVFKSETSTAVKKFQFVENCDFADNLDFWNKMAINYVIH